MVAYMLVSINLEDQSWRKDYRNAVPAIMRSYGGEPNIRSQGRPIETLEGDAPTPDRVALFTFPSMKAIKDFLNSDAYKPYKDARMASAITNIIAFEAED